MRGSCRHGCVSNPRRTLDRGRSWRHPSLLLSSDTPRAQPEQADQVRGDDPHLTSGPARHRCRVPGAARPHSRSWDRVAGHVWMIVPRGPSSPGSEDCRGQAAGEVALQGRSDGRDQELLTGECEVLEPQRVTGDGEPQDL